MIAHFSAPKGAGSDTRDGHEALITPTGSPPGQRPALPSAMAVTALLRLAGLSSERRYVDFAHEALVQMRSLMTQYPPGFGQWLQALSYALSQPREIAITGDPEADDIQALLTAARQGYRPIQVGAVRDSYTETTVVLLLQDRSKIEGRATA